MTRREANDDGDAGGGGGSGPGVDEGGVGDERDADDDAEVELAVAVVGGEERTVRLPADATYGDVVRAVGLRTGEATALVDGAPVPEDRPVDVDAGRVRVLRLIRGGGRVGE